MLATSMSPPMARARRREIASPSPVPPWRRCTAASACSNSLNSAGSPSAAMPMPVSSTTMARPASSPAGSCLPACALPHGHEHAAGIGELDGIADEVASETDSCPHLPIRRANQQISQHHSCFVSQVPLPFVDSDQAQCLISKDVIYNVLCPWHRTFLTNEFAGR